MTIKKTVTPKVIDANRKNGANSRGPHNCDSTKLNARRHGLTAKSLFLDEQEQKDCEEMIADLEAEYAPKTTSQIMAVQDLAILRIGVIRAQKLQLQQWKLRERSAGIAFGMLAGECVTDELSDLTRTEDLKRGAQTGWECTELEIVSGNSVLKEKGNGGTSNNKNHDLKSAVYTNRHSEQTGNGYHVLIRAKINTGIETLQRYERSLRKDSYQVMHLLHRLQRGSGAAESESPSGDSNGTAE